MHKLRYSRLAKYDMEEIIHYISYELKNKKAALDLEMEFERQAKNILTFPYGASEYQSSEILEHQYRKTKANNFYIFYFIDEENKTITISRVLYQKRDIDNLLK